MNSPLSCRAELIGPVALRLLAGPGTAGRVAAVFAPVVYVEAGGQLLALARAGTDPGAIILVTTLPKYADFRALGIIAGDPVRLGRVRVSIGEGMVVSVRSAREWVPPLWPTSSRAKDLTRGLEKLRRRLTDDAAAGGLGWFLMPANSAPENPVLRAAKRPLTDARRWLDGGHPDLDWAKRLIGLGPGLTPSGDDVLGGLMVTLHAVRRPERARQVWGAVAAQAKVDCNPISYALLGSAAEGLGSRSLHAVISDVLAGRDAGAGLEGLARTGHSSGWDALVGATMVLEAEDARADEPAIPDGAHAAN